MSCGANCYGQQCVLFLTRTADMGKYVQSIFFVDTAMWENNYV